ncbi:integral membrane protein, putative [Babesia bigemina]|uniref:Integral membrane protein, putative n=1 Tax=Babesia bigemina TaxID=5866 RepID=A0A061D362_BABBI|nr:integral membrane protein, putative [Babesia bigemina]CDR95048.1 integral membrane protein, putative [Babesia bigemina]|eukprot:XP_012767234.1 integral membrane protein, putative [Babesia bigemina]
MEGCGKASMRQRSTARPSHLEDHLDGSSAAIKVIVFGGMDGILSMFAVVSGCAGAAISPLQTICVTLGTMLASAFSMGYGEYVSCGAERDYVQSERMREEIEVAEKPDCEKREMFEIYVHRYHFSPRDAKNLVDLTFRNKAFFLRHMMVEELGILLTEDELSPAKRGLLMFGSFCILGSFPLLGFFGFFVAEAGSTLSHTIGFIATAVFSLLATMCLGYFKGSYMRQSKAASALKMTFNGVVVGLISYLSGVILMVSPRPAKSTCRSAFSPTRRCNSAHHCALIVSL